MTYFTEDTDYVGEHDIIVYIGLDSEVGNTASTVFKLIIQDPHARVSPNRVEEPRTPRLELQD